MENQGQDPGLSANPQLWDEATPRDSRVGVRRDAEERPPSAVASPRPSGASFPPRRPTGRGLAGSAGPWAAPQPSAAPRLPDTPYRRHRSPASLSPSAAKLAEQKGAEPPSQNPEAVWGREPEASRTSTARPR